jgi:hypothetical protein
MEWRFFVEAKSFLFLVEEDVAMVQLEEISKGFAGVVSLGLQFAVWVVATMELALLNTGLKDFVKSFQEDQQVLIVRRGENRVGCFLKLEVYAEGGRQGLILLLEGRQGRGWGRFERELSKVVAFLEAMAAPSLSSSSLVFSSYVRCCEWRLHQLCLLVRLVLNRLSTKICGLIFSNLSLGPILEGWWSVLLEF